MLREGFRDAEIAGACGFTMESVAAIRLAENYRFVDSQPIWIQVLNGVMGGVMPHPENPRFPPAPPTNCCVRCVSNWIEGNVECKRQGKPKTLAVTCCHWGDGTKYSVAYARQGQEPQWIEINGVDPRRWNELHFELAFTNAERYARIHRTARAIGEKVGKQIGAQVAHARKLHLARALLRVAERVL